MKWFLKSPPPFPRVWDPAHPQGAQRCRALTDPIPGSFKESPYTAHHHPGVDMAWVGKSWNPWTREQSCAALLSRFWSNAWGSSFTSPWDHFYVILAGREHSAFRILQSLRLALDTSFTPNLETLWAMEFGCLCPKWRLQLAFICPICTYLSWGQV